MVVAIGDTGFSAALGRVVGVAQSSVAGTICPTGVDGVEGDVLCVDLFPDVNLSGVGPAL